MQIEQAMAPKQFEKGVGRYGQIKTNAERYEERIWPVPDAGSYDRDILFIRV